MKKLLLTAISLFAGMSLFAQTIPNGSKFMVVNQKNANLTASEASWLPDSVKSKLEENLQSYTTFSFVSSDMDAIKKIQRQSESGAFDEKEALEIGKLKFAKYAVFVTLRKSGTYNVVADVMDLTTGEKLATVSASEKKSANDLFSRSGCAADEITVKLCDKLGISLTNTQRHVLLDGEENVSLDDQATMAREEEEAFKKSMAKYDEEIKRLSESTDLDSVAAKKKMEADRAMAEAKMKAASEKSRRLAEEAKQAAADKMADAQRSEEQKRRRDEMARLAAEKAAEVRKAAITNGSIYEEIGVLENKKKAVIDIQKAYDKRVAEIMAEGEAEFARKKAEIMDAPYRTAELNPDGTPSDTARSRRKTQVADVLNNLPESYAKQIVDAKFYATDTVIELLKGIRIDQNSISRERTVSSLGKDLKVQFGLFNGKTNSWRTTFWLYSNGLPVCSRSFDLTYTDLTGKSIDVKDSKAYDSFMDTVDLYNSLFSRGEPVVTIGIDYTIESVDDFSSSYRIKIGKVYVVDTASGKKRSSFGLKEPITKYQHKVVNSLRGSLITKDVMNAAEYELGEESHFEKEEIAKLVLRERVKNRGLVMVPIQKLNIFMLQTEVTKELYYFVVDGKEYFEKDAKYPINYMTPKKAKVFCDKLSLIFGLMPFDDRFSNKRNGFRLPNYEEYVFILKNYAEVSRSRSLSPVGQEKIDAFGLYDINGNLSELCEEGKAVGANYIWENRKYYEGFHLRYNNETKEYESPDHCEDLFGFRIVCSSPI